MTSTPSGSKEKQKTPEGLGIPVDWRVHAIDQPTEESLAVLDLPFETKPETKDTVPSEFSERVRHLVGGQDIVVRIDGKEVSKKAPFTAYYACFKGALLALSNIYGVWFEIRLRPGNTYECFRLARPSLQLKDCPMKGINYARLKLTSLPITRAPSRAMSPVQLAPLDTTMVTPHDGDVFHETNPDDREAPTSNTSRSSSPEPDEQPEQKSFAGFGSWRMRSSRTARQPSRPPPRRPKGTRDDPFGLDDLLDEPERTNDKGRQLEGIHPDKFEGDRSKTRRFLNQFNRFMLMNCKADIAKDPISKCIYFMSLLDGEKVNGWVDMAFNWLEEIEADPSLIDWFSNPWKMMEEKFKVSFTDYAERERAQDQLGKLRMTGNNLDEYLAAFETLGSRAELNPDDPSNLRTFAQGLPQQLADACLAMENPDTYGQWRAAAQRQQVIYLKKKVLHSEYGTRNPTRNAGQNPQQKQNTGWVWRRPGGNSNPNNQNWCGQGNRTQPPQPHLPPRNEDAMDLSIICKATTDKEKEEYRCTGRCFQCGKQGHLARDCPSKPARARTVQIEDSQSVASSDNSSFAPTPSLAVRVAHLTEEDRGAFMDEMRSLGEDMDFLGA